MTPEPGRYHVPVMLHEVLDYLAPQPGETMLDATIGGGGHSVALARHIRPGGTLIGLDRDADALATAGLRLEPYRSDIDIILISTGFGNMQSALHAQTAIATRNIDGILFDLGVSSHQLDTERGFSFRRDEHLDMRMSRTGTDPTAADLLATASETEIARILWEYGEERFSRRIAAAIVAQRERGQPLKTTAELAALVERAVPRAGWPKEIHVATRTFQGIRIAVNDELGQLEAGLTAAIARLNPGGRLVVLSYHSLEDRITKRIFAEAAGRYAERSGLIARSLAAERPAGAHAFSVDSQAGSAHGGRDRAEPEGAQRQIARRCPQCLMLIVMERASCLRHNDTISLPLFLPLRLPTVCPCGRGREPNEVGRRLVGASLLPGPARSVRRAIAPSRTRGETVQLFLMVCCAGFCTVAGFAYLSCYVMMTNEAYRHAKLSSQILQETQKTQHWKHQHALVNTPDNIEKQAKSLNMVRPDEKLTITVR